MSEAATALPRPLTSLRKAVFAHLSRQGANGNAAQEPEQAGATLTAASVVPARAALKPKRRRNKP